jgi:hypothetical protein
MALCGVDTYRGVGKLGKAMVRYIRLQLVCSESAVLAKFHNCLQAASGRSITRSCVGIIGGG